MTTLVLVEAQLKEGAQEAALAFLADRFPETRRYEGCRDIHAYLAEDGRSIVFVQHWDTAPQFQGYLAWRQESGSFDDFVAMVEGELAIRTFTQTPV